MPTLGNYHAFVGAALYPNPYSLEQYAQLIKTALQQYHPLYYVVSAQELPEDLPQWLDLKHQGLSLEGLILPGHNLADYFLSQPLIPKTFIGPDQKSLQLLAKVLPPQVNLIYL